MIHLQTTGYQSKYIDASSSQGQLNQLFGQMLETRVHLSGLKTFIT